MKEYDSVLRSLLIIKLLVTNSVKYITLKNKFRCKCYKSRINRSWVMENTNIGFLSFSTVDILKMASGRPGIPNVLPWTS